MKKQNLLVNVSGGRSSAMMAYHISRSPLYKNYNKLFIFCNTGQERPETIQFLQDIVKFWGIDIHFLEAVYSDLPRIGPKAIRVNPENLDMTSKVFENAINHLQKNKWIGVPNQATPYCSVYMKVRPANWYAKQFFGTVKFKSAIGFRQEDMPKRISWAEIKLAKKQLFPLITDFEKPTNLQDIDQFFAEQPFRLKIPSNLGNCRYCWKKSEKTISENIIFDIRNHNFDTIDWYKRMESRYNNNFFRNNRTISEMVQISEQPKTGFLDFPYDSDDDGCICTI